jgi:D-glycero-alpha-D-manno-heptose-7-phosphate kinase
VTTSVTPLRLTFGGGGSDLTAGQGVCLSWTIDKYVTVSVTPTWSDTYTLHYSQFEKVTDPAKIQHRLLRRILAAHPPGIQVSSISEIPAGTGLGSSGAFTVGVLRALYPTLTRPQLVDMACEYDIGQQDQWSAVYGGLNVYDFAEGVIRPVRTSLSADDFSLYYTGLRHNSADLLTGPAKTFDLAQAQVAGMVDVLEKNDIEVIGWMLSQQWAHKHEACPSTEHHMVHKLLQEGIVNGAYGGKLVGAGNGGFILFAGDAGTIPGLTRTPFAFTDQGTRCE